MTIVLITTKHLLPTIIPELFLEASDSHHSFLELSNVLLVSLSQLRTHCNEDR